MSPVRIVIAIVLLLLGAVWIGQGTGLIGGSAMSGSAVWAIIGAILVLAALWLVLTGRGSRQAAAAEDDER